MTPAAAAEAIKDTRVLLGLPLDAAWQAIEHPLSVSDLRQLSRLSLTLDATTWLLNRGLYASRLDAKRLGFAAWLATTLRIGED